MANSVPNIKEILSNDWRNDPACTIKETIILENATKEVVKEEIDKALKNGCLIDVDKEGTSFTYIIKTPNDKYVAMFITWECSSPNDSMLKCYEEMPPSDDECQNSSSRKYRKFLPGVGKYKPRRLELD